jgi:transposase InsO family protein
MEDVSAQPRRWDRRNGSLRRSNAFVSASLWLACDSACKIERRLGVKFSRPIDSLPILNHGRRQILSLGVTVHPTAEWIARQLTEACGWDRTPGYLVRDHDSVYGAIFTRRVRSVGIRDRPIAPRSPWQNGHAERLIGSLRQECLDHVIVFGERHLRQLLFLYGGLDARHWCDKAVAVPEAQPWVSGTYNTVGQNYGVSATYDLGAVHKIDEIKVNFLSGQFNSVRPVVAWAVSSHDKRQRGSIKLVSN